MPGGIRNAGGWGDGRMKKSGLKGVCLFLMVKCLEVKSMLYHTQPVYLLIHKFVVYSLQFTYLSIRKFVVWGRKCVRLRRRLFVN